MATKGMYGINRAEYLPGRMICEECYRAWREDITPAGRCPWEHLHETDRSEHVALRKRKAVIAGLWG